MNEIENIINSLKRMQPENFKRESLKAYKRIFSGTIKESFLSNMLSKIRQDARYNAIFLNSFNPEKELSYDSLVCGHNYSEINICKMIVMSHYVNTVMMTDSERGKCQENEEYRKKLADDVVKMFYFERLAGGYFGNSSLETFLPLIYYVSALTNYCGIQCDEIRNRSISEKVSYIDDFNYIMVSKILVKIRACISLADIRATDELTIMFRTLIELFMTFAALWDKNKSTIETYLKYDSVTFDYNCGETIPDEMKKSAKKEHVNEVHYINYGWIKSLEEFSLIEKENDPYTLAALSKILDKKCGYFCHNFGSDLYKIYRWCNPQIHGTVLMMNYFEQEVSIFQNVATMIKFVCSILSDKLFGFKYQYGDYDLINELSLKLDESRKMFDWLHNNQEALDKTNKDYKTRAFCSLKMQ